MRVGRLEGGKEAFNILVVGEVVDKSMPVRPPRVVILFAITVQRKRVVERNFLSPRAFPSACQKTGCMKILDSHG